MAVRSDTRLRILAGALDSVERLGMGRSSLEDVARAAGVSRATVYRYFPGGRDQVVTETVAWEIENFLARIVAAVDELDGLHEKLRTALVVGHEAIGDHQLLQRLVSTEPEEIFRELAEIGAVLREAVVVYLEREVRRERLLPGIDPAEAADYCARLYLSYLGSQGGTDLADEDAVDRLVATQFLPGIVERAPG